MSEEIRILEMRSSSAWRHVSIAKQNFFQWDPEMSAYIFVGTLLGLRGSAAQICGGLIRFELEGREGLGSAAWALTLTGSGRSAWETSDWGNCLAPGADEGPSMRGAGWR